VLLPFTFHANAYPTAPGDAYREDKHPRGVGCHLDRQALTEFQYGSFSQPYKVGPEVFSTWANLIRRANADSRIGTTGAIRGGVLPSRLRFVQWPDEVGVSLEEQSASLITIYGHITLDSAPVGRRLSPGAGSVPWGLTGIP